jgi:hypothetical protein
VDRFEGIVGEAHGTRGGFPVIRPVFSGFRRRTEMSRVSLENPRRIRLSNAEELDVADASLGKTVRHSAGKRTARERERYRATVIRDP